MTRAPPCRLCEAPLIWNAGGWTCSGCRDTPSTAALTAWAAEHLADGVRAGKARREGKRRQRRADRWRVETGIPAGALPSAADFLVAANAGAWHRAELIACLALHDGASLSAAEPTA